MKKLILSAIFLVLACFLSFAQVREVKEIKITSAVGWSGEEHYSDILIQNKRGIYFIKDQRLDKALINNLLKSVDETQIAYPKLENLGFTQEWLKNNKGKDLSDYLIEHLNKALPSQRNLFYESYQNPEILKMTFPALFFFKASDYYPEITVEIKLFSGKKIKIFSDSQTILSLPWKITKNGKKTITYNANISKAISAIMPKNSANKRRLAGEDVNAELSNAIMDVIEDKWNLVETEEKLPSYLEDLRKEFIVQTASVDGFEEGFGTFFATLRKKNYPSNFAVLVELPYTNGQVKNIELFKSKIDKYVKLIFSVTWLKRYILTNPKEDFRLTFESEYSFGDSLRTAFFQDINFPEKKDLIEKIRKYKNEISSIQVGDKTFYSQWLILPNKQTVLYSIDSWYSLMKWKRKDITYKECPHGIRCAATLISPEGKIISK